jgi:hypothetical protein
MRKVVTAILGVVLVAGSAMGQSFNVPSKAKGLKGEMVKAFDQCTTPTPANSSNPPVVLPGCSAVVSDPVCLFGSKGAGKFSTGVSKTDIKVGVTLSGLSAGCEGEALSATADARVTTTDSSTGASTLTDLSGFPVGSCTVVGGKCSVKTTVETFLGVGTNVFKDGQVVSIEIFAVDMRRGGLRTFTNGLRIGPK